jgi:hypothetical protein
VFRPWLRVAQPDDWTGTLVRIASWPVYFIVLLPIAIGRIPESWWLFDSELLTRLLMALVALYLLGWARTIGFTLLPKAVIQYGGRLWFRPHGRRAVVRTSAIVAIDVELRPHGEVFVIELENGQSHELCPVAWEGAQRIFAVIDRRVRRAKLRASRRRAREQRRAKSRPHGAASPPAASP